MKALKIRLNLWRRKFDVYSGKKISLLNRLSIFSPVSILRKTKNKFAKFASSLMEKLLLLGGCYYDTEKVKYIGGHIGWDIYRVPGRLRNYNRRILLDLSCRDPNWRIIVFNGNA